MLGRGKTGSAVAEVARARGHFVRVLGAVENEDARALTPELLAGVDVVIDFTNPGAVLANLRALLPLEAKVVVGTTGWYAHLPEMTALAELHGASLLYGTNFSLGVQAFFRAARLLAEALPGYTLAIEETHHVTKKDAPSGTALTLREAVGGQAPITSRRVGDAAGTHVFTLRSPAETLMLRHESHARTAFAEGAVRAAEWLNEQSELIVHDFKSVSPLLTLNLFATQEL